MGQFWKGILNTDSSTGWSPELNWGDYKGSDKGARADKKAFGNFQKQFKLLTGRIDEIGGEYDAKVGFAEESASLAAAGINREGASAVGNAQDAVGATGFATSGSGQQQIDRTRGGFVDQLRGNMLDLTRQKFELNTQKKSDIFGLQSNLLDLYGQYEANRQNLEYDASGGFNIYEELGIENG